MRGFLSLNKHIDPRYARRGAREIEGIPGQTVSVKTMSDGMYDDGLAGSDYLPTSMKKLRSCIGCGLLQTEEWWKSERCPNCGFKGYKKYTSASFTGMLAVLNPDSWCARWHRFHMNVPGLYALSNEGEVTKDIIKELEISRNRRPLPEWVERAKTQFQAGGGFG